jgi:hypothetical protein
MTNLTNVVALRRPTKKTRVYFGWIVTFLVEVLSSPKGNQGGWEGGARGL